MAAAPHDRFRQAQVAALTEAELRAEIERCRGKERTIKPNKSRRSWKARAELAEEELERRSPTTYGSPEEAALGEWLAYPEVEVRVVDVTYSDEANAVVITDTEPSHPMANHTRLTDNGWVFIADINR